MLGHILGLRNSHLAVLVMTSLDTARETDGIQQA